jgi:hypothetical protein
MPPGNPINSVGLGDIKTFKKEKKKKSRKVHFMLYHFLKELGRILRRQQQQQQLHILPVKVCISLSTVISSE